MNKKIIGLIAFCIVSIVLIVIIVTKEDVPSFVNVKFNSIQRKEGYLLFSSDGYLYEADSLKYKYTYDKKNNTITYEKGLIEVICYSEEEYLYAFFTPKGGSKRSVFLTKYNKEGDIIDYIVPDKENKYNDEYLHGCLKGCNLCDFVYKTDESGNIISYAKIKSRE